MNLSYSYQSCKYNFYISIIDDNKYLYSKEDFLLSDFFGYNIEPADGYPIFKEMINQNLNAHYMTLDENLYNDFYSDNKNNINKFQVILENKINGDFLEKYLEIILRLKVVISVSCYPAIDNLFYNIDYIVYIFLGHGVPYFKDYLFIDYQSFYRYDKIVIPPSKKIINIARKYGWKKKDMIQINYPRYDKYHFLPSKSYLNKKNASIFLMFTWREVKKGKKISELYYNNTITLLKNIKLNNALKKNNITLFYSYHHSLKYKINILLNNYTNIKKVGVTNISAYLLKSNLLITDFSSIVFDFIAQKKPFILYIPDLEDKYIKDIYSEEYFDIINSLKNGSKNFENKYFQLNETINKIIYYIKNNFKPEKKLSKFFKLFNLSFASNTKKFIDYVKRIK